MDRDLFFKSYTKFQLGFLPTEQAHPDTLELSRWSQDDLPFALEQIKKIDLLALSCLLQYVDSLESLKKDIDEVFEQGGRVFLCGCGATGRLSLLIESLWQEQQGNDRVQAFMAGGDIALVHSLEGFEDFPELGERHLKEMQFSEKDLLIASTEGGETPYVIGATEAAARLSKWPPVFLYCNPRELLIERIERSRQILLNEKVRDFSLAVGPMVLSGSTRMQASTVLQVVVGALLLEREKTIREVVEELIQSLADTDFSLLAPFIEKEQAIYESEGYVLYAPKDFAITVFTDTTERAPTFSLASFENDDYSKGPLSFCYLMLPKTQTTEEAWKALLKRSPKALDWLDVDSRTRFDYLETFDFSERALDKRQVRLGSSFHQTIFDIRKDKDLLTWKLQGHSESFPLVIQSPLVQHSLLKILLNTHSTLVMGRLGRYESNIMTWVSPTNGKLIDRATRYVMQLLELSGQRVSYLDVAEVVMSLVEQRQPGSIVLKTVEKLKS